MTQLKNIAEPMRAYSLEVTGAPSAAKAAAPADTVKPKTLAPRISAWSSRWPALAAAIAALQLPAAAGRWYIARAAARRKRNRHRPASLDRGPPVRQSLRRSRAGLLRRRRYRESHHRPLSPQRLLRYRTRHRACFQGQERRRERRSARKLGVRYPCWKVQCSAVESRYASTRS